MNWKSYVVALLAAATFGCTQSLEDQFAKVERFAKGNQLGDSPDVFLIRVGLTGAERVALIYAMADDYQFCREIAESYTARYPDTPYSCELAN